MTDNIIYALNNFYDAATTLSEVWSQLEAEDDFDYGVKQYPFDHSFDEVAEQIFQWIEAFKEEIE